MRFLVDSHSWVEYFRSSMAGKIIKKMIEAPQNNAFTAECSLAELREWALREGIIFDSILQVIISLSEIVPINRLTWLAAAGIKHEQRKTKKDFGLMDALLLAKQAELDCAIITGDSHFKGLPCVKFIEK